MIYFDNAATTCVFPEVVEAMQDAMQVTYGNPSAKHKIMSLTIVGL